jgi:hypothetical protein
MCKYDKSWVSPRALESIESHDPAVKGGLFIRTHEARMGENRKHRQNMKNPPKEAGF